MSERSQGRSLRARIPALVVFSLCAICCILQFSISHDPQASSSSSLPTFLAVAALPLAAFSAPIAAVWVVAMTAVCLFLYPSIPLTMMGFACIAVGTGSYYSRKLAIVLPIVLSLGSLSNAGAFPYQEAMFGSGLCLLAICASATMALFGRALCRILPLAHAHQASTPPQSPANTTGAPEHAIARRLHDHTTNDLTNIMMLADRAQSGNEDSTKILGMIRNLSQDALRQTRKSIVSLEQLAHAQTNVDKLKDLINTQQERLQILGYYGEVIDSYHTHGLSDRDLEFLSDLICELCGNLSKYADPAHPYLLMLSLEDSSCTIESLDYIDSRKADDPTMHGLGTGLRNFKDTVSNTGGEWRIQSDGQRWMLKTVIPFHQSSIPEEQQ